MAQQDSHICQGPGDLGHLGPQVTPLPSFHKETLDEARLPLAESYGVPQTHGLRFLLDIETNLKHHWMILRASS